MVFALACLANSVVVVSHVLAVQLAALITATPKMEMRAAMLALRDPDAAPLPLSGHRSRSTRRAFEWPSSKAK